MSGPRRNMRHPGCCTTHCSRTTWCTGIKRPSLPRDRAQELAAECLEISKAQHCIADPFVDIVRGLPPSGLLFAGQVPCSWGICSTCIPVTMIRASLRSYTATRLSGMDATQDTRRGLKARLIGWTVGELIMRSSVHRGETCR